MNYIIHRVNKVSQLKELDSSYGCEIDLRSDVCSPNSLHMSHDPWVKGENFLDWINLYQKKKMQGPLILNTKEDGLEDQILLILKKHQINNYFFLDTTIPNLIKSVLIHLRSNFAIRISKYEPLFIADYLQGKVDWIWLDCFDRDLPNLKWIEHLRKNYKICLVSPELQGSETEKIKEFLVFKPYVDAICTKFPQIWNQ